MSITVYLSGSMSRHSTWWAREQAWLEGRGCKVYNPWKEEDAILQNYEITPKEARSGALNKLDLVTKKQYGYDVLLQDFKEIRRDTTVVLVRYKAPTPGTMAEIGWAFGLREILNKKIYTHIVNVSGKQPPLRLLGMSTAVHDNFTQWHNYAVRHYKLRRKK